MPLLMLLLMMPMAWRSPFEKHWLHVHSTELASEDLLVSHWWFLRPCQWGIKLENQYVPSSSSSPSVSLVLAFISFLDGGYPQASQRPRESALTYPRHLCVLAPTLFVVGTQPGIRVWVAPCLSHWNWCPFDIRALLNLPILVTLLYPGPKVLLLLIDSGMKSTSPRAGEAQWWLQNAWRQLCQRGQKSLHLPLWPDPE